MKAASSEMAALLNDGNQFVVADIYTFTLLGGTVARYTSADIDLTVGGNTYSCNGPVFERDRTRVGVGLETDELGVKIYPRDGDQIAGQDWIPAARKGLLDGATVAVRKFISDSWTDTSRGSLYQFTGRATPKRITRNVIELTLKSLLHLLNIEAPRNKFQPGCVHTVYDSGCGLNKASFTVSGSVTGGVTERSFNTDLTAADGYHDLGVITMTSGPNASAPRTVRAYVNASGKVTLAAPFVALVAVGNTFTIYPGCDKQKATCADKFSNLARFRGFPFVPQPSTAI